MTLFLLPAAAAWGAALTGAACGADRISVVAPVPPYRALAERIGGDRVEAAALVRPGQDPHHFSITPAQALALGKARVYLRGGLPFEGAQVAKILESKPRLRVVDLTAVVDQLPEDDHDHDHEHEHAEDAEHDHEDEHDHDHGGIDPHLWLSPAALAAQASLIGAALSEVDPAHAAEYEARVEKFAAEMAALDGEIEGELEDYRGRTFYVFHPAFGYFARSYGLEQKAVEVGGKKPSPQQLLELIRKAKEDRIAAIFVQPGFDQSAARQVAAATGAKVVSLDPLSADLDGGLRKIAAALAEAFAASPAR